MVVVGFPKTEMDITTAIDQAVSALREKGYVNVNNLARRDGPCGRYLTIRANGGSISVVSVFFRDNRLYKV